MSEEQVPKAKLIEGRLYLYVQLLNRFNGYMLFDTGASKCVVYKEILDECGLKATGEAQGVSLATGSCDILTIKDVDIKLADIEAVIPSCFILEQSLFDIGENIVGTIGINLITQFNWSIDILKNDIRFKKTLYEDKKASFMNYKTVENSGMYIQGQIEDDNCWLYIDFGYDGELLIPLQFRPQMSLFGRKRLGYRFLGNLGTPIGNNPSSPIEVTLIKDLHMGNMQVGNVNATLGNFNRFNIGMEILSLYKIYLNTSSNNIGFFDFNKSSIEMPQNMDFGLDFNYDSQQGCIIINRIYEYYPYKNKFYIGQRIEKFNNKSVQDFTNGWEIDKFIVKCRRKKSFQITVGGITYTLLKEKIPKVQLN